ncbi:MAG TPA: P22 phage major capsid protein family protein, partial [Methylotenera sp.]|nr:P22 phage major capsid protein family protein [Methylotenera sp.]
NINKKLLKSFTKNFMADVVAAKTVERQLIVTDFDPSTGTQVAMKRGVQYTPQRSADGDLTAVTANPIRVGQVLGEVGQFITVFVENTQVEEALETDQLDMLLRPVAEDMAITLESELVDRMAKSAALYSGVKGTAVNKWSDVAQAGALMKEIGIPQGEMYALISNFEEVNLANVQSGLGVNPEVSTAWNTATIRERFAGFDRVLSTNNLPQYQVGTATAAALSATPDATYTAYKNSYQMSLNLSGVTPATGTFRAGQQFQIAASKLVNMRNQRVVHNQAGTEAPITLTVLEDATAVAGVITGLKVSGAAINEAGVLSSFNTVNRALASGDALVITGVSGTAGSVQRPALAYHKQFFGMGSVQLPKLHALDSNIINYDGFSIRVHRFSDGIGNKNRYRFDMLPTFACFNPFWGLQMAGTA